MITVNRLVLANEVFEIVRNSDGVVVAAPSYTVQDIYSTVLIDEETGTIVQDEALLNEVKAALPQGPTHE